MSTPTQQQQQDEDHPPQPSAPRRSTSLNHLHPDHQPQHQEIDNEKSYFPNLDTSHSFRHGDRHEEMLSPAGQRADASRLNDDLELLRAERLISNQESELKAGKTRSRTNVPDPEDAFNSPDHKQASHHKRDTDAALFKLWSFLRKFPRLLRYFVYLLPGAALILIPVLLGHFQFKKGNHAVGGAGGTYVMWFGIWLEIVWGSLWISRMITSLLPPLFQYSAKLAGSTNHKKWKDVGAELDLHTALFLWMLACLISFKPTCKGHRTPIPDGDEHHDGWIDTVNKVIIALFVLATLNFAEKIIIQWIANSFHQRTYATRIENNKGDVRTLVALFEHAKANLENTDSFWQGSTQVSGSGTQTPMQFFQDNARQVLDKVGHVAGRVGNDLIGRKVTISHPQKVVSELLRNQASSHTLARLIYRSLVRGSNENIYREDMQVAFKSQEDAEAAFGVFDKDLNGDISMEEFEAVCNEVHLEKKAIAASLKDLDSVIQKLDKVFLLIIIIIAIIVFVAILSSSSAAALTSAGTSVLGLAWMLQATAQEFLQSIIFVFVKHPFDVGDRVTIYGSTGSNLTGDDYYVTEISLLYTEFKKMQGHIVQAPNSLLNTLFILNQRRSNGLADPIPLIMRFGTPSWMIEELKARMLDFCLENKRDYKAQIISEMVSVDSVQSCTMNIIFFHKSNFQNELLRLVRHNKFVTELMAQMADIGIQPPTRIQPGGSSDHPMYWVGTAPPAYNRQEAEQEPKHPIQPTASISSLAPPVRRPSISVSRPALAETRVIDPVDDFQDVYENRRDKVHAQRLASIREKDIGEQAEQAEVEARASTSGLAPASSHGSASVHQRSGLFGRKRSRSRSQASHIV